MMRFANLHVSGLISLWRKTESGNCSILNVRIEELRVVPHFSGIIEALNKECRVRTH